MAKRTYPLHIIDRSKKASYPFDTLVCSHRKYPFIARIDNCKDENDFKKLTEHTLEYKYHYEKNANSIVVIVIEDFLCKLDNIEDKQRQKIKSLLKRALKSYLHG